MRFYSQQHEFYVGVDLHARSMHVCVVDQQSYHLLQTIPGIGKTLALILL